MTPPKPVYLVMHSNSPTILYSRKSDAEQYVARARDQQGHYIVTMNLIENAGWHTTE